MRMAALVDGLMAGGSSRTVEGAAPLRLVLGNAAGSHACNQ